MDKEKISEDLKDILFNINPNINLKENFFSVNSSMYPRDVVYCIYAIEDKFGIIFEEKLITDMSFFTFDKISDFIYNKLNI